MNHWSAWYAKVVLWGPTGPVVGTLEHAITTANVNRRRRSRVEHNREHGAKGRCAYLTEVVSTISRFIQTSKNARVDDRRVVRIYCQPGNKCSTYADGGSLGPGRATISAAEETI